MTDSEALAILCNRHWHDSGEIEKAMRLAVKALRDKVRGTVKVLDMDREDIGNGQ